MKSAIFRFLNSILIDFRSLGSFSRSSNLEKIEFPLFLEFLLEKPRFSEVIDAKHNYQIGIGFIQSFVRQLFSSKIEIYTFVSRKEEIFFLGKILRIFPMNLFGPSALASAVCLQLNDFRGLFYPSACTNENISTVRTLKTTEIDFSVAKSVAVEPWERKRWRTLILTHSVSVHFQYLPFRNKEKRTKRLKNGFQYWFPLGVHPTVQPIPFRRATFPFILSHSYFYLYEVYVKMWKYLNDIGFPFYLWRCDYKEPQNVYLFWLKFRASTIVLWNMYGVSVVFWFGIYGRICIWPKTSTGIFQESYNKSMVWIEFHVNWNRHSHCLRKF